MNATGHISEVIPNEGFYAFVPFSDTYLIEKRQIYDVGVRIDDGRRITNQQRKKIYATMRDISEYTGYEPEQVKAIWKYNFIALTGCDYFSLSDVDVTTANDYLEYLIEFCLEHDIPTEGSLAERSPDIARYIYWCLVHKKCCITQKKAQLHHVDAVGMGRDRKDIIHHGMRVLPLQWKLHREAHDMGKSSFEEKYHVFGIKLDADLCDIWNVKKERTA
ncbi:MAG: hypothetical protein LBV12_03210 [Puniceicoccales bacterium]|jgi:hypothetical protein|nr:hypothetical protein [Puniceicoccales bacterium]